MKKNIIGRKEEQARLSQAIKSNKAELIAVYGRRRIGKTYLIKEYFNNKFTFYATGVFGGKKKDEIEAFCEGFDPEFKRNMKPVKEWMDAFVGLRDYLKGKKGKKIVFLDELPWFDVPPSRFLKAFEWFWNSWGSTDKNLKLIVCGSATSWMRNKFISSKGGLYNRTTEQIYLPPFRLHETKLLLNHYGIRWNRLSVLDIYMILGGVPYYLRMLDKNLSQDSNIDRLFFKDNAPLKNEYEFLLKSLFKDDEYYKKIIDAIAGKNSGMTRKEIIEKAGIGDNGGLTRALKTLIDCDFIREYPSLGKNSRDSLFQLIDPFILFYKKFVDNYKGSDEEYWKNNIQSSKRNSWRGISFELVCLLHLKQIKTALGINGIGTWTGSWYHKGNDSNPGAQIDLLIDRVDKIINICEMKYSSALFEITKKIEREIRSRIETFLSVSKTTKTLSQVLITTLGVRKGKYQDLFNDIITAEDLFK